MYTKEEAIREFFLSFKTSLNMLSLYSEKHPFFTKSIEEFKKRIDALFVFLNPLKVGVALDYLAIEGKPWERSVFTEELARTLHLRKIKNIEINQGVSLEELTSFLSSIHLTPKQIFSQGGLLNIFQKEKLIHIAVEELDYSQLLKDEGGECKDIWAYLLGEAMDKGDRQKLNEFADNVTRIIKNFSALDLAEDEELKQNLSRFLSYLKDNHQDKFSQGLRELAKSVLGEGHFLDRDKVSAIAMFLKDLSAEDFTEVLFSEILANDSFDNLGFNLFALLSNENRHQEIASLLAAKLKAQKSIPDNLRVKKKLKELFSSPDESSITAMYRNVLSSILQDFSLKEGFAFDRESLYFNYLFTLLNLLAQENSPDKLKLILARISSEWGRVFKDGNQGFLKDLLEVIQKIKKENPTYTDIFLEWDKRVANFIENEALKGTLAADSGYLLDILERSSYDFEFYLNKIFQENEVSPYSLKLFLKFFPEHLADFYTGLERKHAELEFLQKLMDSLNLLEASLALEILKKIYVFSNNLIKIEALKAMQKLNKRDVEFLLSILRQGNINLKRQALLVLMEDEEKKSRALDALLFAPKFLGKGNDLLLENIGIIEEVEFKEAADFLLNLSKNRLFWNSKVRKKSAEVLKKFKC